MPSFSVTLTTAASTTPGNSAACPLSWQSGRPTTVSLSFGSSTAFNDCVVQYSLDDVQRTPSSAVTWMTLSSGISNNSTTAYHLASTTWFDTGFLAQFLTPLAAVRLRSTALDAGGSSNTLTLKVLQGEP